jgi:quercetin dioxygenase-like cupin family protein
MHRSVATLAAILLLAGTAQARDARETSVETLAHATTSWDGAPLPAYPTGQPEVTVLRIRIPPGAELPLHHHPVINAGFMLKGALTVVSETGATLRLRAGDALVELVNTRHAGRNEGRDTAEIVVFYAGSAGQPITVKDPR